MQLNNISRQAFVTKVNQWILAVDLGGTNLRAQGGKIVLDGIELEPAVSLSLSDVKDSKELFRLLQTRLAVALAAFDTITIAAAGMYVAETGVVHHADEYYDGELRVREALEALGVEFSRVRVINDFAGQSLGTLADAGESAEVLLPGKPGRLARRVTLGPGTGLGVNCLKPNGSGGWIVLPSEGGNIPVPVVAAWQADFVCWLSRQLAKGDKPRRTPKAEDILSGAGFLLVAKYLVEFVIGQLPDEAIRAELGLDPAKLREFGKDVINAGPGFNEAMLTKMVSEDRAPGVEMIFSSFLGLVARTACLMNWSGSGEAGDVYLTGGVLQHCPRLARSFWFRRGFCAPHELHILADGEMPDEPCYHSRVLEEVTVRFVTVSDAGVQGALVDALLN